MIKTIRNSMISQYLTVLLIGYFLISSINLSSSLGNYISDDTEVHSASGAIGVILKKIFKCSGCPEELDDYDNKDEKTNKGLLLQEYLIPFSEGVIGSYTIDSVKDKTLMANSIFLFAFCSDIHLPPPERIC